MSYLQQKIHKLLSWNEVCKMHLDLNKKRWPQMGAQRRREKLVKNTYTYIQVVW